MSEMYEYVATYNGKHVELKAESLYDAKLKAVAHFKAPKSKQWLVHVTYVGKPIDPASL